MPNVVSGEMNYTARRVKTRFLPTLLPDIKEPALAPTPGRERGGGGVLMVSCGKGVQHASQNYNLIYLALFLKREIVPNSIT